MFTPALKKEYGDNDKYYHGGAKIGILFSSGKNNILRTSAPRKWNIVFTTRKLNSYFQSFPWM